MRFRTLALTFVILTSPSLKASEHLSFVTRDGITVAAKLSQKNPMLRSAGIIVVSPGYAQHKDTPVMRKFARDLSLVDDVLSFDYRGTNESAGRFWFGAHEYQDLEPILVWAKKNYAKVTLLGFSLGAYSALRGAYEYPGNIDELLLVSCPTRVDEIVWGGGVVLNVWDLLTHWNLLTRQSPADQFFRWGYPFLAKPSTADLSPDLKLPLHFLVGGKDRLISEQMTRKVYDAIPNATQKSWTEFPDGSHAEAMIEDQGPELLKWVNEKRSRYAIPHP